MSDHPSPGEDYHYLNPHLDGPIQRQSPGRLGPVMLFLGGIGFTVLLGALWFLQSISSRAPA